MEYLRELTIEVTNLCDQKCLHCSSLSGKALPNELTFSEIKNLVLDFKDLGGQSVILSGGEPLLRPDITAIIHFIRAWGLKLEINTAGSYPNNAGVKEISNDLLKTLAADAPSGNKVQIVFSLLGIASKHDYMTGINGSFRALQRSILLAKIYGLDVGIHTVLCRNNFQDLTKIFTLLRHWGVNEWYILRLVNQGRASKSLDLELNPEEFKEAQTTLIGLRNLRAPFRWTMGHNIDRRYLLDPSFQPVACSLGHKSILVRADGSVTYCPALKHFEFGNIRDYGLRFFWEEHEFIRKFRDFDYQKLTGKCSRCDLAKACLGGCPAQRLHHYGSLEKGPDPLCFR